VEKTISATVRLNSRFIMRGSTWSYEQVLNVANANYVPSRYEGNVLLIRAKDRPSGTLCDPAFGWQHIIPNLSVVEVPGNHTDIFIEPNVQSMASAFSAALHTSAKKELALVP